MMMNRRTTAMTAEQSADLLRGHLLLTRGVLSKFAELFAENHSEKPEWRSMVESSVGDINELYATSRRMKPHPTYRWVHDSWKSAMRHYRVGAGILTEALADGTAGEPEVLNRIRESMESGAKLLTRAAEDFERASSP